MQIAEKIRRQLACLQQEDWEAVQAIRHIFADSNTGIVCSTFTRGRTQLGVLFAHFIQEAKKIKFVTLANHLP